MEKKNREMLDEMTSFATELDSRTLVNLGDKLAQRAVTSWHKDGDVGSISGKLFREASPAARFILDAAMGSKVIISMSEISEAFRQEKEEMLNILKESLEDGTPVEPLLLIKRLESETFQKIATFPPNFTKTEATMALVYGLFLSMYCMAESKNPGSGAKKVDEAAAKVLKSFIDSV